MQHQSLTISGTSYYFSRVKDTYTENGQIFIALFGRLTIETPVHSTCIWEDAKGVPWTQANSKLKAAPNGIYTYKVQEMIFHELERLSRRQQNDLYTLTPIYQTVKFSQLNQTPVQPVKSRRINDRNSY